MVLETLVYPYRKIEYYTIHTQEKASIDMECPNCKKPGPHFVGPSFGEDGFYICDEILPICQHIWGIDGLHSNIYCKVCFITRPTSS